jgi:nucleoside-diphosphate-sugar epimerase
VPAAAAAGPARFMYADPGMDRDAKRILIAGCGYVGAELGRRLAGSGHRVWGLSRRPGGLPDGVEPLAADLTDAATLDGLPAGLDAVVYCAAADGFHEDAYRRAYREGPRHLLAALERQKQGPGRVVFTSSTGVHGQTDGEWVDEDSAAEAEHFSGRIVLQGEEIFRQGPFPALVARLGGIYGPGRTRLINRLRRGEATCVEGETSWTNRIHRDDAAGALAHLLALDEPRDLYLVVDREPADDCEVLRWIAERLGVEPPPVMPASEGGRQRRSNKRVSNRLLLESGYELLYPTYREGYGELIAAGGDNDGSDETG